MDIGNERVIAVSLQRPPPAKALCILSVYMPSGRASKSLDEFRNILSILQEIISKFKSSHNFLIGSDFNHDLFNRRDPNRKQVIKLLKENQLFVLSDGTKFTMESHCGRHKSHIDIFITDDQQILEGCPAAQVLDKQPYNSSVHTPIILQCQTHSGSSIEPPPKPVKQQMSNIPKKPKWASIDKSQYEDKVQEKLQGYDMSLIDARRTAKIIEMSVFQAAQELQPRKPPPRKGHKRRRPWTRDIANAVKHSKAAHFMWKDAGKPPRGHPLFDKRKKAARSVRSAQRVRIALGRRRLYSQINKASSRDQKLFHKLLRRQRTTHQPNVVLKVDGRELHDPGDISQAYRNHFEKLATPLESPHFSDELLNSALKDLVLVQACLTNDTASDDVEEKSVSAAIRSLNRGKATDNQGVTAEHLQFAEEVLKGPLCQLLKHIREEKKIPDSMKEGRKIPIPKKGKDPSDPNNARGITITSQLGKLVEAHIKEVQPLPKSQNKLQFGFTKECSPEMTSLCLTEAIAEADDLKIPIYIASLDAQKAFDVVSHPILFKKILVEDTPRSIANTIMDLYTNCTEVVIWKDAVSSPYAVSQGVRQGGVISTDLYKLYLDHMLDRAQESMMGFPIGTAVIGAASCADDVLLIADTPHGRQWLVDDAHYYGRTHRFNHNLTKSVVSAKGDKAPEEVLMGVDVMPAVDSFVHLGLERNLAKRNIIEDCIIDRVDLGRRTAYALMGVGLHGKHGLNPSVSLKIITTYVIPRMLYGLETVQINITTMEKLELFYRGLLKDIQGLPKTTATEAVFLLIGALPLTAELHARRLLLAGAVGRLAPDNPLRCAFVRQLAVKGPSSNSWIIQTMNIAELYNLDLPDCFDNPPVKSQWKLRVRRAVTLHWQSKLIADATEKSPLRYLSPQMFRPDKPQAHPIWIQCGSDPRRITPASVRARMLCGALPLQATIARTNKKSPDPTCQLCMEQQEDMVHFLLDCPALQKPRADHLDSILQLLHSQDIEVTTPEKLVKIILNGSDGSQSSQTARANRVVGSYRPSLLGRHCDDLCNKLFQSRNNILSTRRKAGCSLTEEERPK